MTTSLKHGNNWQLKDHGLSSQWWPPSLPITGKYDNQPQGIKQRAWSVFSLVASFPANQRKYDNQPQGIRQRVWSVFSLVPSFPANQTQI